MLPDNQILQIFRMYCLEFQVYKLLFTSCFHHTYVWYKFPLLFLIDVESLMFTEFQDVFNSLLPILKLFHDILSLTFFSSVVLKWKASQFGWLSFQIPIVFYFSCLYMISFDSSW